MADKMNTQDKLAEALRDLHDTVASGEYPKTDDEKRALRVAEAALAAHAAEAAQAAEPDYWAAVSMEGIERSVAVDDVQDSDIARRHVNDWINTHDPSCHLVRLYAHPQAAQDAKDWTDVQCIEFMQVGLRNVQYASVRGAGPTVDEIRQGARVAMAKESGR